MTWRHLNFFQHHCYITAAVPRVRCVTSQLPVSSWHEAIGDPTLADAILDRIVHNDNKIELKGESMRKHAITLDQN